MSNPPYSPFLKGDLEGFLYEVMGDTIKCKNLYPVKFLPLEGRS